MALKRQDIWANWVILPKGFNPKTFTICYLNQWPMKIVCCWWYSQQATCLTDGQKLTSCSVNLPCFLIFSPPYHYTALFLVRLLIVMYAFLFFLSPLGSSFWPSKSFLIGFKSFQNFDWWRRLPKKFELVVPISADRWRWCILSRWWLPLVANFGTNGSGSHR